VDDDGVTMPRSRSRTQGCISVTTEWRIENFTSIGHLQLSKVSNHDLGTLKHDTVTFETSAFVEQLSVKDVDNEEDPLYGERDHKSRVGYVWIDNWNHAGV
jgi:hypothetical protein